MLLAFSVAVCTKVKNWHAKPSVDTFQNVPLLMKVLGVSVFFYSHSRFLEDDFEGDQGAVI